VLHLGPVTGPVEAVRAAIVTEQKRAGLVRCPSCRGTGFKFEMRVVKPQQPKPPRQKCPACNGAGWRSG
jgi:hypothetical protein